MLDSKGYAIVDVETTGLFPGGFDRIIEIAIIRLDENGKLLTSYSTLVNPHRDIGPTHIHGITTADVLNAPLFEDIIGDVIHHIRGAALVGHNVSFDRRFLRSEFERLQVELPDIPCFCTMRLAGLADRGIPSRRLDVLCDYFGINLDGAHTAYADAKATTELFRLCVNQIGGWHNINPMDHCIVPIGSNVYSWPDFKPSGCQYCRQKASEDIRSKPSYIETLIAKLPVGSKDDPVIDEYLTLLDHVLEDRIINESEYCRLELLANELNMSRDQAVSAHNKYLRQLISAALEDGVITSAEHKDLEMVSKLLGISEKSFIGLLEEVQSQHEGQRGIRSQIPDSALVGHTICFTGEMVSNINGGPATRSLAQKIATDAGLIVQSRVTKNLDILVVADPHSMSGKARKAREYGIRIIAEPVFWRLVGVRVD